MQFSSGWTHSWFMASFGVKQGAHGLVVENLAKVEVPMDQSSHLVPYDEGAC